MQNPEIKKALGNCLSGATKALADSAAFDDALQNKAGVTGTNTLSPRPGPHQESIMAKSIGFQKRIYVKKKTTIGNSTRSRPKNKHKKRCWKKYRGQ